MCDRAHVLFHTLDRKNLSVTVFSRGEIACQRAGIPEIAEAVGKPGTIFRNTIIGHRRFPAGSCLDDVAAVKENAGLMLVLIRNGALESETTSL